MRREGFFSQNNFRLATLPLAALQCRCVCLPHLACWQVAPFASDSKGPARSRRLRVLAATGLGKTSSPYGELAVGLRYDSLKHFGVQSGQLLLLYTSGFGRVPSKENRRATAPGYAFGYATQLEGCALPAGHARLHSALRLQLGCETGKRIFTTSSLSSQPSRF